MAKEEVSISSRSDNWIKLDACLGRWSPGIFTNRNECRSRIAARNWTDYPLFELSNPLIGCGLLATIRIKNGVGLPLRSNEKKI